MRILIIEDEVKIADYLQKGLVSHGFIVEAAYDGAEGLFLASHYYFDVIILDVMLPKLNGFACLRQIRERNKQVHILLLSACAEITDRVKGLEWGADDYLVKPFAFSELLARVRTLLRRGTKQLSNHLLIADLSVDKVKHKAERQTLRLDLTPKEFSLLILFMERAGEVLSRTFIAEHVWDINFDSDTNIIDVAVRRLRKKVDEPFNKKLIHTIRGLGYLLEER